ncbi:MAG: hypothetical protein ABT940_09385 [Alphaproteobacteria bacterium]
MVAAPVKTGALNIVMGVNDHLYQPGEHHLLTAASCTTNCLVPDSRLVESKSFKLLLASFRNHGAFHEACTLDVAKRALAAAKPQWLRIGAYWYPRGGIPIDVFWQSGPPPEGLWLPDQDVASYRGRG